MPSLAAPAPPSAPRGQARSWRPSVAVFLGGTLLSLGGFLLHTHRLHVEATLAFSNEVQNYLHRVRDDVRVCRDTLEGVRTLQTFSPAVDRATFATAAAEHLRRYPPLQAIEWAPRVPAADLARFEAAQQTGIPGFRVYDRAGESYGPPAPADAYLPILYSEPLAANLPAIGFNVYSGRAGPLIARAVARNDIALSMRLPLFAEKENIPGLLLFLPVFHLDAQGAPRGPFRGVLSGALSLEKFLASLSPPDSGPPFADILLVDRSPDAEGPVIGLVHHNGRVTVDNLPAASDFAGDEVVVETFDLWTRRWEFRFRPHPGWLAAQRGSPSWTLLTLGLLTSGALGLLVHTRGRRTAFIESQVEERTRELRAAQAALTSGKERYRAFINESAEPIWRCELRVPLSAAADIDTQIAHVVAHAYLAECNDALARAYGYADAHQLVGRPLTTILDPAVPKNRAFLHAFLASADYRLTDVETQEIGPLGATTIFLNSLVGIVEDRRLVRAWGTQRDITARREAELALSESRRLLDSMMDQLPGMSVRCTAGPGYPAIYISSGVERLTGYPARDFFSGLVRYTDLIHPEDAPRVWPELLAQTDAHHPFQIQYRIRDRLGHEHWVLEVGHGLYDARGQLEFIDSLTIDITAQKLAEAENSKLERKLAEGQKLESLGVLAGGIAHDFNNLLTAILGHASLVRTGGSLVDNDASLEQIEVAARRAAELCQQMLAYAGKSTVTTAPLDLGELVRGTLGLLEVSIGKNIRLAPSLATALPPVLGDATQLRQIIMNLVINAADAIGSASGGCIELSTFRQHAGHATLALAIGAPDLPAGDYIALEVRDNGCGMAPALVARIFEPFFTTKFAGRGLGLSAVLGIVQAHRGALFVTSVEGEGTAFRLLLPPHSAPAPAVAASSPAPMQPLTFPGRTALVVDDEPTVRQITASVLKRFGITVHAVASGDDAIVLVRDQAPALDLVFLDLTMPGLSGEDTLRILHGMRPELRVILMSGYSESGALRRLGEHGAIDFLQKPFDLDVLHAKLTALLPPAP